MTGTVARDDDWEKFGTTGGAWLRITVGAAQGNVVPLGAVGETR